MDTIYQNWEYTGAITIPVGGKMDVWGSGGTPKFPLWPMPPRAGEGAWKCYAELIFELDSGRTSAIVGITYPTDAIAPTYPWLGKQHGGPRITMTAGGGVYYRRLDFIDPTTPQDYPAGYAIPGYMWAMKANTNGDFPSYSPVIQNIGSTAVIIGNIAYYAEARPL